MKPSGKSILLATLILAALASPQVTRADVFMDLTAFDHNAETAVGFLNGISFTLESTNAVPRPALADNGGVLTGGTINEGSPVFSSAVRFTPSQALGDDLLLGGTSDFRLLFAQPLTNITLHISELQANRLSFTTGGVPASFTLLSGDGDLTPSAGNTAIQGNTISVDDASGSLLFAGTFTELSWASVPGPGADSNTPNDGFRLQASVVPEPSAAFLGALSVLVLFLRRNRNQRNA